MLRRRRGDADEGAHAAEHQATGQSKDAGSFVATAPVVTLAADSAAAIANNAAACYVEGWEQPVLTADEKTDPAARYKLATKLKGLFMHETDGHYDDYRKVRFAFPCFDFLLTYLGTLDVR